MSSILTCCVVNAKAMALSADLFDLYANGSRSSGSGSGDGSVECNCAVVVQGERFSVF